MELCITCIKCGNADGGVTIAIGIGHLLCTACNESYTASDVRDVIAKWNRILPWIEAHPDELERAAEQEETAVPLEGVLVS